MLFIICTEFLSTLLNENDQIKGFQLNVRDETNNLVLTQYADDTCIFLSDFKEIDPCLKLIETFSSVSGLHLNIEKTEGICIGSLKNIVPNITNIKWTNEPIKYLGIYIAIDQEICYPLNWVSKLGKMQKLCDTWRTRKLTLQGKITVIKSLILPQIIFSASVLPLPDDIVKNVNKILFNFIWGKTEKIKRKVLINDLEKGGLAMIDTLSHFMALKASWLPRIIKHENEIWTKIPQMYIRKVCGKLVESMNFSTAKQFPRLQQVPLFYQEIICGFCRANNPSKIDSKNVFYNQHIWGNRHLTSNGKCLYMTPFIDAGYMYVKDILNPDGTFKQNIYENLKVKNQYLRSMSMIMSAFKPYKNFLMSIFLML